ncbi:MAG: amidohydrolase family protein [Myxococcota bacterium]
MDQVIRGAAVYDGSGAAAFEADVAIVGERIGAVGLLEARAPVEIDGRGLALAPGFIDVHTHDDFAVRLHPDMAFKTRQGVTTCVVGNCGFGAAPWPVAERAARSFFHPGAKIPRWEGYAGYLQGLERDPAATNTAALVGHGTVRGAVLGAASRAPDAGELRAMRAGVDEGVSAGAVGLSTGLIYPPGRHAATGELVELAGAFREGGGLYATHMRDEGEGLLEAVEEALEIGRRAGVPVQISHHKASGRRAWGLVRASLARLERARAEGLDVMADQYPYTAGSTSLQAVEGWIQGEGGTAPLEPEAVQICSCPSSPEYEGLRLDEVATRRGETPRQAARALVQADGPGVIVALHSMDEADVRRVMAHPTTMIGSDGIPALDGKPHPRLYGTFPRVLGRYVRELGLLSLEQAIHRMTGMPAERFGLVDRGRIVPGAFADLVLFDPEQIRDVGTFEDPKRPPEGIRGVWVNGRSVVRDTEPTGARPGKPLRRGSPTAEKSSARARSLGSRPTRAPDVG